MIAIIVAKLASKIESSVNTYNSLLTANAVALANKVKVVVFLRVLVAGNLFNSWSALVFGSNLLRSNRVNMCFIPLKNIYKIYLDSFLRFPCILSSFTFIYSKTPFIPLLTTSIGGSINGLSSRTKN
eukprot:NODE_1134_length_2061_cov_0.390928.p3 type:complete len:127 gc:universal NODE_1134_length_2061_cov_0.390928:1333-1713(+)